MKKSKWALSIIFVVLFAIGCFPAVRAVGGYISQPFAMEDNESEIDKDRMESNMPIISWDFDSKGYFDGSGKIWYGMGEVQDTLKITVSDNCDDMEIGLYAIKITDNDIIIYEEAGFPCGVLEHTETYIIGEFEDGSHTIVVAAEDNAGNTVTDTRTFYIDRVLPESGVISVAGPQGLILDGLHWFDKDDIIAFRLDCVDVNSGIKMISMTINEQSFDFEGDEILSDDDGNYVIIDTTDIETDVEHMYTVTGIVTDVANNSLILEPFAVYKDLENPCIRKFTVEEKAPAPDKGLNVLPFGTFSNGALIFKAYASDAEFDIGLDYVTVLYDGLSNPIIMADEGEGVFSVEIPADEDVTEYNISVTAYDKFGKSSTTCPNFENAVTGDVADSGFVMVETIKPSITLNVITDDETASDDLIWYSSIQSIELKVQDENSGIRNVDFLVNGIDFALDKDGVELLKTAETELLDVRISEELSYVFDIEYIASIVEEPIDGIYSVKVEIIDNAGNISTYDMEYYLDNVAPQIDEISFSPLTADGEKGTNEFIRKLEYGLYFKTDFTITVYISDKMPSSGLDELQYRFVTYQNGVGQEELKGIQKISDGRVELMVPQGFKGQIFVEAFDNMGNSSGEKTTKAYVVDNTVPDISITNNVSTPYQDAVGNNLYTVDNGVTVEITDMVSGIREIGYTQSSENNPFDRIGVIVSDVGYNVGDSLDDGWVVASVDMNLVTKVTKTFEFNSDDNDVILTFDATDNALNTIENIQSEKFTVDKTRPIIDVSFRADESSNGYYNQNRIADIMIIERNFSENLITAIIENMFGAVPEYSFSEQSATEHTAVINFDEGYYIFDVTGTDLGNHEAIVNFSGGNERRFCVDKTAPVIEDNFSLLVDPKSENSFNSDKIINIKVIERNFDANLSQLRITSKGAGEEHNTNDLVDVTYEVLRGATWSSLGDLHEISFTVSEDAVYQVELAPMDLAGNSAERKASVIFEIDKTAPIVTAKNEMPVSADDTERIEIYSYVRKDDPAPTVEFDDLNLDHINYALTVYIPDHTSSEADTIIRPSRVYLDEDQNKSGIIIGNKFTLPDFVEDGVYALELVAVDVAGNESTLNLNTYARTVNQDVLAYITESNSDQKTGLYSFQYENGVAISKRPDDFKDISICVLAREDTAVDIVLRDSNGIEINTNAQATADDNIYGMNVYNYTLSADFFKENFQDDTDMQLILTVKSGEDRIDLGRMHIDNIAPTCDIPEEFRSWHWYYGGDSRTITIANINELIDESQCKVYDNGKEVPFNYSDNDNTICFTLEQGWHNVGIVLSDMAGNTYIIQEKSNIHIGFFWLWFIVAVSTTFTILIIFAIVHNIGRKRTEENRESFAELFP